MNYNVPKVATVQSFVGYGRCSTTVIMPILAAMGVQTCPIPTTILSTHTGGLGKPSFVDLTGMMDEWINHWKGLDLAFDALSSGFLGTEEQINQVLHFFKCFKTPTNFTLVDPVMGDGGKLYRTYTASMQQKMHELVKVADIITPNLTEAYFLLGKPYTEAPLSSEEVQAMAEALGQLGPDKVVIKGVTTHEGERLNFAYDKKQCAYWGIPYDEIPMRYHGTGDAFAAVLVGELVKGMAFEKAVASAADFVRRTVAITLEAGTDPKAGILLELVLGELMGR